MAAKRHRVVSVLVDGMASFEPAVADEFFGIDRSRILGIPWYRYATCTPDPDVPLCLGGFRVVESQGHPLNFGWQHTSATRYDGHSP